MMQTILLTSDDWDLVVDTAGNIAVASDPYARAQDAASEIRLFQRDAYYDQTRGIPYWIDTLGKAPPLAVVKAHIVAAAKLAPGVAAAQCFLTAVSGRQISGQVQVVDAKGVASAASF